MKKITQILVSLGLIVSFGGLTVAVPSRTVSAAPITCAKPSDCIQKGVNGVGGSSATPLKDVIGTIVDLLLFIAGVIGVVMIILGGIRYTTSQGDQKQIAAAKSTILYSVIGVVVALLAYAVIHFVVGKLT